MTFVMATDTDLSVFKSEIYFQYYNTRKYADRRAAY